MVVRCPWFSIAAGGFIPRVSWRDPEEIIHIVDGPDAFTMWQEAEQASRFLRIAAEDGQ
jgi:hypothetical protein